MQEALRAHCVALVVNGFTDRTAEALGPKVMKELQTHRFCVVGCGGAGSNFAEMLVRTGATKIDLVDGTEVKRSGLNRVFAFSESDCGAQKAEALKDRLCAIRPDLTIRHFPTHFRTREQSEDASQGDADVWLAVAQADAVFIAVDNRDSRLAVEKFCSNEGTGRYLSCGIRVDPGNGDFQFTCNWRPKSQEKGESHYDGYGPKNASFGSIVVEATSVAFTMLLSHLMDAKSDFTSYYKRYDDTLRPIELTINGKSSYKIP